MKNKKIELFDEVGVNQEKNVKNKLNLKRI